MRLFNSTLSLAFSLCCAILPVCLSSAAQEKPASPAPNSPPSSRRPLPSKKQPANLEPNDEREPSTPGSSSSDADGPEAIRKRAEWFYKQRSSVNGHIPSGARLKALQHMRQMMLREGKLTQRPDGSYAEVSPQASPLGAVTTTWASVGPTPTTGGFFSPVTGRITTIAVDPSDATGNTVLIGGAMGGIWRSTDAGATWTAVGDQNASLAMGSIAFATSQPATVYAGTGEQASIGFDIYYGAGVLKSTDHGQTWTQTCTVAGSTCPFIGPYLDSLNPGFGFFNFGGAHISYVAVSPTNPNMVLVGTQFIVEGPQEGVYCSDNGGTTWSNILPDEMSTFVGFASSTVAYAALGNPFGSSTGAPNGNGIFKATGIGSTCSTIHFTRLSGSLPPISSMGRIDMGIAPSDTSGNTVYASISDASTSSSTNLGVFVTTNGGTSWTRTTAPDVCQFQCWYDNVVKVDPNSASIAFFGGSSVSDSTGNPSWVVRTTNGGGSWSSVIPNLPGGSPGLPHVDNHAIAFVKLSTGKVRMYLGNDGGIWRTDDAEAAGVTWTNLNNASLSLTQFYPSISIDPSSPAIAFGGTQDNASQNFQGGLSWVDNQLCGDGASTAVDFLVPSTVYIGCATGAPINASYQNGSIGTFSPAISGINLSDAANFIPPLAADPNNANVVYFGTSRVYQSVDAGNTWIPLSAPLVNSAGDWLTAIAVEQGNPKVAYTGSSAGEVFAEQTLTTDGNPPSAFFQVGGFPIAPRAVTAIVVDPTDATGNSAYVALSGFSFNGTDPLGVTVTDVNGHIFKTTNANQAPQATFTDISCSTNDCSKPAAADLPNIPVNDIVLDPDIPGTIYAATDLGVFVGNCSVTPCTWSTLSSGLPRVAVLSLRLHEPSRTLRAATHGRGAWDINLNNFSFTGPHISSLSPVSIGVGAASLTLTVNGSGLTGGSVQWNGSATGVTTTPVSDTQLTASIASSLVNVAGTSKITVLNATQSNALTFSILAGTPTLTSISPPNTPVQTTPSTAVTIQLTGTSFSTNAKVLLNGAQHAITVSAPTASCQPPTCITATLPAALLGPFGSTDNISVSNLPPGGGQSKPVNFQVVAPPPPNDNFANAINITTLTFNDVQDSSGATTETTDPVPPCVTQSSPAQGNTGGHPNGAYNTIWYKFTPVFSANLEADTANSSYDTVLSVWTGSAGTFANIACNDDINPGIVIQSQVTNVPLTAGTTYYIMVGSFGPPDTNPIALGGRSQLNFSYNGGLFPTPAISSLSPASANSGDPTFTLTVNGSGFLNGASIALQDPTFQGTTLTTTFVSSTQVTAVVPASAIIFPGGYQIFANNPQPSNFSSFPFTVNVGTYPVPTLTSIFPTSVIAGGLFSIPINASGTNFAQNAALNFGAVTGTSPLVFGHTSLSSNIPASALATPGTVQVTVSNPTPGGGPSNSLPFTITAPNPLPTITSLSPASAQGGASIIVTVTGTGFLSGAEVCLNLSFGISCGGATFLSSTQLSLPIMLPSSAGTIPFYVVDPAPGGTSAPFNFTVTAPPDFSLTASGPTTVTVTAGQTATFTNAVTVSPLAGFNAQVTLSCASPASLTTCNVNPSTFASGSGTATVTVTTTKNGLMPPSPPMGRFYLWPQLVPLLVLAILVALLMLFTARTRRQRLASVLPFAILIFFLVLQAIGCGGGTSTPPPPPPPPGTPPGTYTVTVTGTASTNNGALTHTTTLTLTVN